MNKKADLAIIVHPHYWDWEKYPFRGIDRYNYELVNGLKKRGLDIDVIDSGYIKSNVEGVVKELIFPFRFIWKKAGLFHACHPMGAKWAVFLKKRPLITTIHDLLPLVFGGEYDSGLKYFVKRQSIKLAIKNSDKITVGSVVFKEWINKEFNVPLDKIAVVYDGIDRNRFRPGPTPENSTKRVLYLGEVIRAKGADSLIKAFKILLDTISHVELVIGGTGRELGYMKSLCQNLGVADKVKFLGMIPEADLPKLYKSADVFAFPSRFGAGLALWEAMASGIPVISGDRFDTIDCIGNAGIRTNPDRPEEIAEAMKQLLTDKNLWLEYRRRGLEHVEQFSWGRMVDETIGVYSEFIK